MTSLLFITIISLGLATSAHGQFWTIQTESPTPAGQLRVMMHAFVGDNITMPCKLDHKDTSTFGSVGVRVKWTKLGEDESLNEDVLLSMGFHKKTYGSFEDRAYLDDSDSSSAALTLTSVSKEDAGTYRCEMINGMTDTIQEVTLEVENSLEDGVVFPYSPNTGRYNLNFTDAVQACAEQGAVVASHDQLYNAWRNGLDWCNAGWLSDGTVKYPIVNPRGPCGGTNNGPGLRSYGRQSRQSLYDVFCFASALRGRFYWLVQPVRLTFAEAVQACLDDGAEIAKVGHIFAAWKLENFDRCDAGWLADGSVRYPISRPRKNCSPTEAAVRFVEFPDKMQKSYGVYCFRAEQ